MELSADAKFGIGVVIATIIIIAGGAFLASRSSSTTNEPTQTISADQVSRIAGENRPSLGADEAQVTVVEFGDFECPACGAVHPILKQVKEKYKDSPVKFIHRNFPLPQHDLAQLSAEAAEEAYVQGKFWEYHDMLYEKQPKLERADLERYAQELGLNVDQFKTALDEGRHKNTIKADQADGRALGVNSTPSIFINNTKVPTSAYSVDGISAMVDAALAPNPS